VATVAGLAVGDGDVVSALDEVAGPLDGLVLDEVVAPPLESEEPPPQPASSTRAAARAQTLEERVRDISPELNRYSRLLAGTNHGGGVGHRSVETRHAVP